MLEGRRLQTAAVAGLIVTAFATGACRGSVSDSGDKTDRIPESTEPVADPSVQANLENLEQRINACSTILSGLNEAIPYMDPATWKVSETDPNVADYNPVFMPHTVSFFIPDSSGNGSGISVYFLGEVDNFAEAQQQTAQFADTRPYRVYLNTTTNKADDTSVAHHIGATFHSDSKPPLCTDIRGGSQDASGNRLVRYGFESDGQRISAFADAASKSLVNRSVAGFDTAVDAFVRS